MSYDPTSEYQKHLRGRAKIVNTVYGGSPDNSNKRPSSSSGGYRINSEPRDANIFIQTIGRGLPRRPSHLQDETYLTEEDWRDINMLTGSTSVGDYFGGSRDSKVTKVHDTGFQFRKTRRE